MEVKFNRMDNERKCREVKRVPETLTFVYKSHRNMNACGIYRESIHQVRRESCMGGEDECRGM